MDASPPRWLGAVLAGGASRRFGAPKALARLGGVPVAARTAAALAEAGTRVGLVANDAALYAPLGLETRPDRRPGEGPLAGVEAALAWAEAEGLRGALCVACDLPFVRGPLLRAMLAAADDAPGTIVVPASRGRRGFEPLCAVHPVAVRATVAALLDAGRRAMVDLLETAPVTVLPLAAVEAAGDPDRLFLNLNTPDDLRRAASLLAAEDGT